MGEFPPIVPFSLQLEPVGKVTHSFGKSSLGDYPRRSRSPAPVRSPMGGPRSPGRALLPFLISRTSRSPTAARHQRRGPFRCARRRTRQMRCMEFGEVPGQASMIPPGLARACPSHREAPPRREETGARGPAAGSRHHDGYPISPRCRSAVGPRGQEVCWPIQSQGRRRTPPRTRVATSPRRSSWRPVRQVDVPDRAGLTRSRRPRVPD